MTFGFILLTAGLAALIAGIKGVTIADVLKGAIGADNPIFQRGQVSGQGVGNDPATDTGYHGTQETQSELRDLLHHLQGVAASQFNLRISEPIANGTPGHALHSYHHTGEAFDASGDESDMHDFAGYVQDHYQAQITELIHNPGFAIKNGKKVGIAVYAEVWEGHKDHVHVAIHWRGAKTTRPRPRRGAHTVSPRHSTL